MSLITAFRVRCFEIWFSHQLASERSVSYIKNLLFLTQLAKKAFHLIAPLLDSFGNSIASVLRMCSNDFELFLEWEN